MLRKYNSTLLVTRIMTILITGSNGFIGARYAARLKRASRERIIGVDLQERDQHGTCDEYVRADLGTAEGRERLNALPPFERVLHAGGISGFMVETDNPQRIFDVNITGTFGLLDLARRRRVGRIVLCSTLMVYGPDAERGAEHDESEYPRPISVYGASKLAIEGLMHAFAAQYGVDAVALRFTHVYGPGRTTECFVRDMLAAAAEGSPCRISQASRSLRQYVHVDDVCDSIERAMTAATLSSRVFNISADEMHTLGEVAEMVRRVAGRLDVSFDEARDLPNYRIGKLSLRRAREELGYVPRWPLAAGISEYWSSCFRPR